MPSRAPIRHRRFDSDVGRRPWWLIPLAALALTLVAARGPAEEGAIPAAPQQRVTDQAGLLSPPARSALDAKLASYERKTGHQVVVWIGESLEDRPLDDFAVKAFEAWQIGRKGHDDGVLLIVFARDHKMAIEVGYGLEPNLPDALASRIINEVMAPRLRAEDADGALDAGVDAILASIEGKAFETDRKALPREPVPNRPGKFELILFGIAALAFLVLFLTNPALALQLLFVMASSRGRRDGGGGGWGGGGGFRGGGGRSGGGGARGSW
jgi:uncharacterized protein